MSDRRGSDAGVGHRADALDVHQPLLAHAIRSAEQIRIFRQQHVQDVIALGDQATSQHRNDDLMIWRTAWTQRLKHIEQDASAGALSNQLVGLEQRSLRPVAVSGTEIRLAFEGSAPTLVMVGANNSLPNLLQRSMTVVAIALLFAIVFLARSWRSVCEFVATWPHLLGVIFGIAWWLWLSPSFLGWVIVMISLVSAARPSWYGRTVRGR